MNHEQQKENKMSNTADTAMVKSSGQGHQQDGQELVILQHMPEPKTNLLYYGAGAAIGGIAGKVVTDSGIAAAIGACVGAIAAHYVQPKYLYGRYLVKGVDDYILEFRDGEIFILDGADSSMARKITKDQLMQEDPRGKTVKLDKYVYTAAELRSLGTTSVIENLIADYDFV